jgi:hypothetical protein
VTVRRFVVVAVLAVSVAGGGAAVAALSHAASARSGPAAPSTVYSRLAHRLKQQLPWLARALATAEKPAVRTPAPRTGGTQALRSIPRAIRPQPSTGYSCTIAAGGRCSLHPCTVYTYTTSATASATAAPAPAIAGRCRNAANAPVRQIPIGTG